MSYSLDEVLRFFDYAEEKGLLKPNTAKANKAVVSRVASVLDASEQSQLERLPANEIYARFRTKFAMELSPDSLRVYKSRFQSALESFQKWKQEPEVFPIARQTGSPIVDAVPVKQLSSASTRRLLPDIPVPLSDGSVVTIVGMPLDLSVQEAQRFKRIIDSYIN